MALEPPAPAAAPAAVLPGPAALMASLICREKRWASALLMLRAERESRSARSAAVAGSRGEVMICPGFLAAAADSAGVPVVFREAAAAAGGSSMEG